MPDKSHYLGLARQVRVELNGLAFKSYRRRDFTDRLRVISEEPTTRIKTAQMAPAIEAAFLEQGLRFFPKLSDTRTYDVVRVWRAGTLASHLLDLFLNPGETSDKELGEITRKVKGQWEWAAPTPN